MELKKNPKANLEKSKALFFQFGMIVALAVMLAAFEWSTTKKESRMIADNSIDQTMTETVPVTRPETEQPAPLPPKPEPVRFDIVENDEPLPDDFLPEDNTDVRKNTFDINRWVEPVEETADDPIPFMVLEDNPKYNGGGMDEFRAFVAKNVVYPALPQEAGVQGTVYISFIINEKGYLVDAQVVRSSGNEELDNEALRAVKLSERWTPGKQREKAVKVICTIPVAFRLTR
jgi:protein TonB